MMNLTVQQGWQCPMCQHVYSPTTPMCYYCPPKTTVQTTTEKEELTEQKPVGYLCENGVGHKYFRWKKPSSTYKPIPLYTKEQA